MATTTPTDADDLIRTVLDAFSDRDFDAIAAAHAPDVVLYENGTEYRGYDAVEEHMAAALNDLDDPTFDLQELVSRGDTLACRYTISADGDDSRAAASALCLAHVADGKLQEVRVTSSAPEPVESTPEADGDKAANVEAVRSLYEAASDGEFDVEAFLAPLAADVEWIEPDGSPVGGVHRGHDGVVGILDTMVTEFEAFEVVPDRFIAEGDAVAVPVTEQFVLDGGDRVDVRAVHLYDLKDGQIVRMENVEDTARLE